MTTVKRSALKRGVGVGAGAAALLLLVLQGPVLAGPRHHEGRRHEVRQQRRVKVLPRHREAVRCRPAPVRRHRPFAHRRPAFGFWMVAPPVGFVVGGLPPGFAVCGSGRNTLYLSGGVAYKRCPRGFVVVKHPHCRGPHHRRSWKHRHHRGPRWIR